MRRRLTGSIKTLWHGLERRLRQGFTARGGRQTFPRDPFAAQSQLLAGSRRSAITIFDVGAHTGETARKYRARFPDATIYCFEPFPDSIAALERRFARDAGVHIVPQAVSQRVGRKTFYVNELAPTNSLLPRPAAGRRYYPSTASPRTTIEVEVTTLDAFTAAHGISAIDILKFDIQGGELMALQGAEKLLRSGGIPLIYTEIMFVPHYQGGALFPELWSALAQFGYSFFDIYDLQRATNGQLRYGDALFVSQSLRDTVIDAEPDEP
jgi:FkbM family methyltransferase